MGFAFQGGASAVAQYYGHKVWVDPAKFVSTSVNNDAATLLHEVLHQITGQDDAGLQSALGLAPTGPIDSVNISHRLEDDCFR